MGVGNCVRAQLDMNGPRKFWIPNFCLDNFFEARWQKVRTLALVRLSLRQRNDVGLLLRSRLRKTVRVFQFVPYEMRASKKCML
jgi:hypothetical protein